MYPISVCCPYFQIRKWYQIIIFTASMAEYADPVLDHLDPQNKLVQKRLFRNVSRVRPSRPLQLSGDDPL
jgi:TFIIF-interacting CTD phosphatase-like protein